MSQLTAEKALIFRITHIQNAAWILSHGLHCSNSETSDPNYIQIGNADLIAKRATRAVDVAPGGTLSDYIPFYFTPYTPMLLNIKTGYNGVQQRPMRDIVILVSSLHRLQQMGVSFVFSDQHAYLRAARFSNKLEDLNRVDWKILQARDFKRDPNDLGKMDRYQAEALVHLHMPVAGLLGIICYEDARRLEVAHLADGMGITLDIKAMPGWYV
jgi:hypothetical protein